MPLDHAPHRYNRQQNAAENEVKLDQHNDEAELVIQVQLQEDSDGENPSANSDCEPEVKTQENKTKRSSVEILLPEKNSSINISRPKIPDLSSAQALPDASLSLAKTKNVKGKGNGTRQPKPNDYPFVNKNLSGFCVMCETKYDDFTLHLKEKVHKDKFYVQDSFDGVRIIKPDGASLEEMKRCDSCKNVFYKGSVSHGCILPAMDPERPEQPKGHERCVMCQSRFLDIESHFRNAHENNTKSYKIKFIRKVKTLLPKFTDEYEDLEYCCHSCQVFSFKNRPKLVCNKIQKSALKCKNKNRANLATNRKQGSSKRKRNGYFMYYHSRNFL
ncbi:Hypothetical predicted protein [Cloeon dipterum]|uniref:Uncharacterized protein n=1 Tax=Cloeon dipterum TaxID=197152 RepID=A0A8S1BX92_9INSE|nr:Hypothetical predicted protein [Cloeon dipterum]